MDIYIERERRTHNTNTTCVKGLLEELGINYEEVLVSKNGVLVGEEECFEEKDDVRLLSVISGG